MVSPVYLCACPADCPTRICSGVYVQKAFQCSGKITTIETCQTPDRQNIQVYLTRERDDSLIYPLNEVVDTRTGRTEDVNAEYQAGDTIAYRINKNYMSK